MFRSWFSIKSLASDFVLKVAALAAKDLRVASMTAWNVSSARRSWFDSTGSNSFS
jgi:hypothetical protein